MNLASFTVTALALAPAVLADTWDNTAGTAQWSTATNWADNTEPTSTDAVILPNPIPLNQATILMTTTEFCSTLTFNADYTLQGGQMFIINGGVSVAGGHTATINTVINGSAGLAKTGFGTLRLIPTSSNSFSGPISITGINSTLYVRSNLALGNTVNDIDINAGKLQLDGITSPTFLITGRTITPGTSGGTIELMNNAFLDLNTALGANANTLAFTGQGTVELNTSSARTGATLVSAVLLRLNGATALGTPGSASLSSGAVLEINNGSGTFTGTVAAAAGTAIRGGTGTHTFNGIANVNGNMTLNGGPASTDTLILGSDGSDVLRLGAGATTMVGVGTIRLSSANSYAGAWTTAGVLDVGAPGALGTGTSPIVVNSPGRLTLNTPSLARDITLNNPGGGIELLQDCTVTGNIPIATNAGFVPIIGSGREFTLTGAGSSMTYSGNAYFGGAIGVTSVRVNNGADVTGAGTRVFGPSGGNAALTISGAGSTWQNTDEAWFGNSGGTGSLLVEAGGSFTCPSIYVGQGQNGSATVTGSGSLLTSANLLVVGFGAGVSSSLSILDGAGVVAGATHVGELNGASGSATISGAGSSLTCSGTLQVGSGAIGTINATNGGAVSCQSLVLGNGAGASGTLTISSGLATLACGTGGVLLSQNGAASTLTLSGGSVDINGDVTDAGSGASTFVLDAATLDMHGFAIGAGASPIDNLQFRSGTLKNVSQINNGSGLTKTGPGTLVLNTSNSYTGPTTVGEGALYLFDSTGSNTGSGLVVVGGLGTLAGNGHCAGPVSNGGVVSPQGPSFASPATLHMLDSYTQLSGGSLDIQLYSGAAHDAIDVSGPAVLSGTLTVSLRNAYLPSVGDHFTIMSASSISGTFASLNAPTLSTGLDWRIDYSPAQVQLRVVSTCPADIDSDGDYTNGLTPDGGVDINDLLAFLDAYGAAAPGADVDDDGVDPPNPDGGVDINDLLFFLFRYENGC